MNITVGFYNGGNVLSVLEQYFSTLAILSGMDSQNSPVNKFQGIHSS